nr:zinc finger MYM-type protein 1-like [Hydra vulgaris]
MTNSTPDLSHSEQIIFVFRFLHFNDNQLWEVKERFLKLEELEKKKGSDITKLILNVLEENELDIKNCRGQGYDNGANVAGIYNGVQALIRQNNPQAIFIPCSAHSLNLCAVYAIESSALAKSYFENIQNLYNLFSSSPVRWKILQEETGQSLHKLSVTRWSSRIESVKPLAKKPILKSLHRLKELDLPGEINNVSLLLQSTQLTLDDEVKILNSLLMDLDRIRLSWDLILIEATEVAKNLKFDKIMFTVKRTRKKIIPNETAGYNHKEALKNFECNVFNVALDNPTSQMRSRFKVIEEECCKFSFLWSLQKSQTDQELGLKAVNLAKLYPEDLCKNEFSDEVRHFFSVRRNILVSEKPVELLNEVYAKELHSIFPQVCVSLRILLTLPVSTSEGERSFSKLAIIKDYLRSTMGQERLCYLMILSIESDLAINVNY